MSNFKKRGRKNNIYKDIYKNFDYQPYDDDLYNEEYKQMNSTEMASGARVWFDTQIMVFNPLFNLYFH